MQRMGGGSRKKGGGNDPRCGCDMRVGWDLSFGNRPQAGGNCNGSCSIGMVPQTGGGCGCSLWKGGKQTGGGCGCSLWKGGKRHQTRKSRRGGSMNMNPAPVDFKGFGVTLSDTKANVTSIADYNKKGGGDNMNPAPVNFKDFGVTLSNTKANVSSIANYNKKGGAACDFPCPFRGTGYCDFYAKGGANYGEPMSLQAKLRGGGMNGCGCLSNPFIRGYSKGGKRFTKKKKFQGGSELMAELRKLQGELMGFLANNPPIRPDNRITSEEFDDIVRREADIITIYDQIKANYNVGGAQDPQEIALIDDVHAKLKEMEAIVDSYQRLNFGGGSRGAKRGGSNLISSLDELEQKIDDFLNKYPLDDSVMSEEEIDRMDREELEIKIFRDEIERDYNLNSIQDQQEIEMTKRMYEGIDDVDERAYQLRARARGLLGGYKATRKNRKYLKKWKEGKSIGFTMTSSLKAKGLIPRTSRKNRGKKIVSAKYK